MYSCCGVWLLAQSDASVRVARKGGSASLTRVCRVETHVHRTRAEAPAEHAKEIADDCRHEEPEESGPDALHGEGIVHLEAEEEGKPEGAEKGDEAVEYNLGARG